MSSAGISPLKTNGTWRRVFQVSIGLGVFCSLPVYPFQSVDHRGACYGTPTKQGSTVEVEKGRGYDLVGYGTEYGLHCKQDQGRFVYRPLTGDFDVSVQVIELNNEKGTAAKAGLIARAHATDLPAKYIGLIAISDLPNGKHNAGMFPDAYTFETRQKTGGDLKGGGFDYHPASGAIKRDYPNVWLRLVRKGNTFNAFYSIEGMNWKEIPPLGRLSGYKPFNVELPATAYVGFCVSSNPQGSPNLKSTAKFRNIRGFEPGSTAGIRGAGFARSGFSVNTYRAMVRTDGKFQVGFASSQPSDIGLRLFDLCGSHMGRLEIVSEKGEGK